MLTLEGLGQIFAIGNPVRITDFQIGTDTLSFDQYLSAILLGWDRVGNPFASGYLKLVQSGSDTLLQLDRDGAGTSYAFDTLLTFGNTVATAFTAKDLGYSPLVAMNMAPNAFAADVYSIQHEMPDTSTYLLI